MASTETTVSGGATAVPPLTTPLVLRATGVSKRYGGVQALCDVDLEVAAGEVVALAGENGSGKSTLSKVIAGLVVPDTGVVEVAGEVLPSGRPRVALEAGIALVSQELTALPHLSVAENVLLPRSNRVLRGFSRRRAVAAARPYLRAVGLDVDPALPMGALGPGDREMVEVAKALASRPRLLILDEATARLPDPARLFGVVDDLVADGTAVVFITHRLQEIRRLSSRAVVLRDGIVTGRLGKAQLSDAELTTMMVGRDLGDFYHKRSVPTGGPALEVEDVVTDRAPSTISLTVNAGEIVGLAGLVGSGRSELLESISGVRRRHSGRVRVSGGELHGRAPREAMHARLAFVPEDRFAQGLVSSASILTNLALPHWRALAPTNRRRDLRRAREAVDRFRIRCSGVSAPVRSLSGGNAQKVVIARALEQQPRVLVLDEPTRGVDVGARSEIYELLVDSAERGLAVLMASSDLPELIGLCDRIAVLHDGRLAGVLPRGTATEEAIALLALGGGSPS